MIGRPYLLANLCNFFEWVWNVSGTDCALILGSSVIGTVPRFGYDYCVNLNFFCVVDDVTIFFIIGIFYIYDESVGNIEVSSRTTETSGVRGYAAILCANHYRQSSKKIFLRFVLHDWVTVTVGCSTHAHYRRSEPGNGRGRCGLEKVVQLCWLDELMNGQWAVWNQPT